MEGSFFTAGREGRKFRQEDRLRKTFEKHKKKEETGWRAQMSEQVQRVSFMKKLEHTVTRVGGSWGYVHTAGPNDLNQMFSPLFKTSCHLFNARWEHTRLEQSTCDQITKDRFLKTGEDRAYVTHSWLLNGSVNSKNVHEIFSKRIWPTFICSFRFEILKCSRSTFFIIGNHKQKQPLWLKVVVVNLGWNLFHWSHARPDSATPGSNSAPTHSSALQ